jgi:uncharacterized membrane protein YcaP (DUF421 family)
MEDVLFKDWDSLQRVAVCAVISYFALFAFIRISGKRTLAKINAFDFVVTITLGSTLSSMILANVTITEGAVALLIIIGLQYLLAKLTFHSAKMEKLINSQPVLLYFDGQYLESNMEKESITRDDLHSQARKYRLHDLADVKAIVMEINGELTVIKRSDGLVSDSSLQDLDEASS